MVSNGAKFIALAMNIFIALKLSAHILPHATRAPNKLTADNVTAFIREMGAVTNGQRKNLNTHDIADYLMQHIVDHGEFKTTLRYDIQNIAATDSSHDLTLDKGTYINDLLQGLKRNGPQEGNPTIEYVRVDAGGQTATAMVDMPERGLLPVTDADGAQSMMLVAGTSYCEQNILLNNVHVMQIITAVCTTDMALADRP